MQVLEGGPGQEGGGKAKWVCLAPGRKPLRGNGLIVCVCVCVCVCVLAFSYKYVHIHA